jgi:hypothetical protein
MKKSCKVEPIFGFKNNTALGVDVKTCLRKDRFMQPGKEYTGVFRRDWVCDESRFDEHYTFVETFRLKSERRNPHVFAGEYITITRRDDGALRLNFKPMPHLGAGYSVERYTFNVYCELQQALKGLVA